VPPGLIPEATTFKSGSGGLLAGTPPPGAPRIECGRWSSVPARAMRRTSHHRDPAARRLRPSTPFSHRRGTGAENVAGTGPTSRARAHRSAAHCAGRSTGN
jgi:hypothetical protein